MEGRSSPVDISRRWAPKEATLAIISSHASQAANLKVSAAGAVSVGLSAACARNPGAL